MCRAWRSPARDPSSNTPLAPAAHSAKSRAPAAGRRALRPWCLELRAKGQELRASSQGLRTKHALGTWPVVLSTTHLEPSAWHEGLRAACEGSRALPLGRRAERFVASAKSDELSATRPVPAVTGYVPRAKDQVLRAKCSGQKTFGSHPADLGFETRCVTPIEGWGRASQFPWGRGGARSRRAVFPSPFVSPVSTGLFQRGTLRH